MVPNPFIRTSQMRSKGCMSREWGLLGPCPEPTKQTLNHGSQIRNRSQASQEKLQPLGKSGGDCHGCPRLGEPQPSAFLGPQMHPPSLSPVREPSRLQPPVAMQRPGPMEPGAEAKGSCHALLPLPLPQKRGAATSTQTPALEETTGQQKEPTSLTPQMLP